MRTGTALLLLAPAGTLIIVVFLLPFGLVFVTGFWSQKPGSWIVDDSFTLANYLRLLQDPYFITVVGRTLRVAVVATASCLVLGFPLALWIARSAGQLRGLLIVLMLLPVACGALIQTLGLVNLLGSTGIINGSLRAAGLIGSSIHFLGNEGGVEIGLVQAFLPLMVLPLATMLSRISPDLPAAAATLGASKGRVLWRIIVPLASPGIAAGCILVLAASLTSFVTPQVLGQGHVQLFGPLVYQQAALVLDWPFASALSVLMLVCLAGLALLLAGAGRALSSRNQSG